MSYKINDIEYCDHCFIPVLECQKQSKIFGICRDYNAATNDGNPSIILKPLGLTDEEAEKNMGV